MVVKNNNNGVSLISLIITIIVIIILAAVVIFSGMDTPEKAQLSKVISDIDNVQTAVDQAYYGLYTEKAVAGEVWTKSQFYEAVATGEKNRDNLTGTGLVEISENSLVDINLPKYEGRKWYIAVSDVSDTVQTGSVVLDPGFESQGKIYATLLDVQTGGSTGSGTSGSSGIIEPENIDDWDYVVMEDGNIKITRYRGSATTVVIPNYIGGVKVTVVGDGNLPLWDESICSSYGGQYDNCYQETITKVIISEGIEGISYSAFCRSEALQSVIIPSSVTSIEMFAFSWCNSLTDVTVPNSVTSIGYYAFWDLSSSALIKCEAYSKPDDWNSNWTNANVMWGWKEIPKVVEGNVDDWVYTVNANNTITLNKYKGSETEITIPNYIMGVPVVAINGTGANGSIWDESICEETRWGSDLCTMQFTISRIFFSEGIIDIGENAFMYTRNLQQIILPSTLTSIGNYAFSGCSGFTGGLIIPSSVTSIGDYAFSGCSGFTGSLTIPSSVTSIGSYAFSGCSGFTGSLTIPSSVTSIRYGAFRYCTGLTSVTIPNSVTDISGAFQSCTKLTSVTIPNSVTDISNAFRSCTKLTSVTIPNSVTDISMAFADCTGLTSITIPSSVTSIGTDAFNGCTKLKNVTIPNSVTSIGIYAFYNCSSLTSVTIPSSVTSIKEKAFYGLASSAQIKCEVSSKPDGWVSSWTNCASKNIIWGAK